MKIIFANILLLGSFAVNAQNFKLPPFPGYDSISIDEYQGNIDAKEYFFLGKKVAMIGYSNGYTVRTPFWGMSAQKVDSCYAYYEGDGYDIYYFGKDHIKNEKFSESENIFRHHKFDYAKNTIEKGNYYIVRELYVEHAAHSLKYKIGKWKLDVGKNNSYERIDYDKLLVNGKELSYFFTGNKEMILQFKRKVDGKLNELYGEKFVKKHIQFNLDRSAFHTLDMLRQEQPSGKQLLRITEDEIFYVDLSYDLVIEDIRSNVINIRIDRFGNFVGRTHTKGWHNEYTNFAKGLDKNNTGKFHELILDWKDTAIKEGFNIGTKEFNVRFEWIDEEELFGGLWFVIEESIKSSRTTHSFDVELRQLYLNPWTGQKRWKNMKTGTQEIKAIH